MINEASALALAGARQQGVRLRLGLPPVWGDKVQIQQVLLNLIRNAVKAMADCPRRELTVMAQPRRKRDLTAHSRR